MFLIRDSEAPNAHEKHCALATEFSESFRKGRDSKSRLPIATGCAAFGMQPQGHPFPEMTRGFWCLVSAVEIILWIFFVDFVVDFFGPFSLEERAGKNPPKNPPKNLRFSRDIFDQNPLREISTPMQPTRSQRDLGRKVPKTRCLKWKHVRLQI